MAKAVSDTRRTHRSAAALIDAGLLPPGALATAEAVAARYAVAVTPATDAIIDRDDPDDPIARQFVPSPHELNEHPGEDDDPIGDAAFSPVDGIVHRYRDRVLLMPTHTCATYCRYCFRREQVGASAKTLSPEGLEAAFSYIRDQPEVWEVILSGGDPLVLSPRRLGKILTALNKIDHVGVIRIHTRVPIVDPRHVDENLINALNSDKAVYVLVHCNHPRELTPEAVKATRRVIDAGIPVLSQSVLLRGVNDDAATLDALFRALVRARIKPYYLHHLDRAPGTEHFRVPLDEGRALVDSLRGDLSGLCQPTYVLDIPGGHGKVPVARSRVEDTGDGAFVLRDPQDGSHIYRDGAGERRLPTHDQADRFRARSPLATSSE